MGAVISDCGQYRYVLRRSLGSVLRWHRPIVFIMLNPSIADATKNDRTINRCIEFAKREGRTHLTVVNLFALRSTEPKGLLNHPDPVGPFNDEYLAKETKDQEYVVAAWGMNKFARLRAEEVRKKCGPFICLGMNKDGSPRHPLYLPGSTEFIEWGSGAPPNRQAEKSKREGEIDG